ncbi:hypothetical protein [Actinomadura roseirufa]|uniref:hypothetical protein n=1 Tax=Actinomadura roseirufa TaxID=2094049 RepID=UPI00104154F2|nr:hypothetical protein [Actinomadura roseirufa]
MVTVNHELPLEMIRNRPQLVPTLLRGVFGVDVPAHDRVTLASESYADLNPAELRCDATVLLGDPDAPSLGVVAESQLRPRIEKTWSWPAYLALLRLRRKCDVTLLVFCPDRASARGCAAPIDMGHPGWVLRPLAFAPEDLPPVTDPATARDLPELAVLSAPAHADGPQGEAVVRSLSAALDTLDGDSGPLYHDYLMSQLSLAARKLLEETVKIEDYQWQSDFAIEHQALGEARGEARGERKALLNVLKARGIAVPDDVRRRVMACTDSDQLERWVTRAVTVDDINDLFD